MKTMKSFHLPLLFFALAFLPIVVSAKSVSKQIDVYLVSSYSYTSGADSYQEVGMRIENRSTVNILITGIMAYRADNGEVFYITPVNQYLQPYSSLNGSINYTGRSFLMMGGWYVQITYFNMDDNKNYNKIAYKEPNHFGTNMLLKDVSENDPSGIKTPIEENEIISIFDIQGHKLDSYSKGVNILRFKNGETKKVYNKQ